MTLHQLRIFECVSEAPECDQGIYGATLDSTFGIATTKAFGRRIRQKFFVRLNQAMELTSEGKEFFTAILPLGQVGFKKCGGCRGSVFCS